MLIIIIAWLYVVILMSMTEHSVIAGVMTFLLYGVLPLSVVVYLLNTPARRARRKAAEAQKERRPLRKMRKDPIDSVRTPRDFRQGLIQTSPAMRPQVWSRR